MIAIERVQEMIEEATQSLPGTVTLDLELWGLDGWDSMGMVVFMGLVKDEVGVELEVHELRSCGTSGAVRALIAGEGPPPES